MWRTLFRYIGNMGAPTIGWKIVQICAPVISRCPLYFQGINGLDKVYVPFSLTLSLRVGLFLVLLENYFICKIGLDGVVGGFSFADNRRNPRTVHLQGGHGQRE